MGEQPIAARETVVASAESVAHNLNDAGLHLPDVRSHA